MPVRVNCPQCKTSLLLADEHVAQPCRCSQCRTVFKVAPASASPQPAAAAAPAPPAKPAPPPARSKKPVPSSQSVALQKSKPAAGTATNTSRNQEPTSKRTVPQPVRKGFSCSLVLLVALACFAVGFLSGGGLGYVVSTHLSKDTTPAANAPVAQAEVKKEREHAPVSVASSDSNPSPAKPKVEVADDEPKEASREAALPAAKPAPRSAEPAPRKETAPRESTKPVEPAPAKPVVQEAPPPSPPTPRPRADTPRVQPDPAPKTADPPEAPGGPFVLPTAPGGWVMTEDNVTLIVSIPSRAQLIYFDTVADKEVKRVSLDFKPADLALRGNSLIVVQKGASIVHVLDADSGKEIKEVRVPGEPLDHIACAPQRGPVFVSNSSRGIYAIDPVKGTATKTSAAGQFVAVDPNGAFLYTGTQDPIREHLVVRRNGSGARVSLQKTGRHAHLMKYDIKTGDANLLATNGNASINGAMMRLSPDGKRIALPGGGGWESLTDKSRSYSIAIWDTKDLETMLGQVEVGAYPRNVAFHPVLNLVAADHNGDRVSVYNGKSLAELKSFKLTVAPGQFTPFLLTFGGKGSKVIYVSPSAKREARGGNFDESPTQLHFLPLDLSDEDKAALEKAYNK